MDAFRMRILFVFSTDDIQSTSKPLRSWSSIQFGISYISAVLKSEGHDTRLLVLGRNEPWPSIETMTRAAIDDFDPRVICFTSVFSQYAFIERVAASIKRTSPSRFLLLGGVHATLNPGEVIGGSFDAICVGEGELATAELCRQLDANATPHGIANLWIKGGDGVVERNATREFLQDLDALPFPDREMWAPWIEPQLGDELSLLLGRGCPYACTYCSNHVLKKVARGRYVRMRSPENVVREIAAIHATYPYRKIYFEVESVALHKKWAFDLMHRVAEFNATIGDAIAYGCNYRIAPQAIDEDLFAAFRAANVYKINIGLESGSERVRRDVLKRNYSNDDFVRVTEMARRHGLKVFVFNMIGVPGESLAEHMETVALNRRCQPDGHFTGIFFPYPGTELHDLCVKDGLLHGAPDTAMERRRASLDLPHFTRRQIRRAYRWFNYRVYRGHRPLAKILAQTMAVTVTSNPTTNLLFRKLVMLPGLRQLRARLAG